MRIPSSPAQRQERLSSPRLTPALRTSASTSGMRGRSRIDPSLPSEMASAHNDSFTLTHSEGSSPASAYGHAQQLAQHSAPPGGLIRVERGLVLGLGLGPGSNNPNSDLSRGSILSTNPNPNPNAGVRPTESLVVEHSFEHSCRQVTNTKLH